MVRCIFTLVSGPNRGFTCNHTNCIHSNLYCYTHYRTLLKNEARLLISPYQQLLSSFQQDITINIIVRRMILNPLNFNISHLRFSNPPENINNRHRNINNPSENINNRHRNINNPPQNINNQHRNINNPPQNINNRHRNINNPPQYINNRHRNINNPPQNINNQHRNINNPPQNINNQHRNINNPPQNINNRHRNTLFSCKSCNKYIEHSPSVTLECNCHYHLSCFLLIPNQTHCQHCNDKIHKTDDDYPDCSICLDPIKNNIHKTICGHSFHTHCIHSWFNVQINTLDSQTNCPNCRHIL